MKKITLLIIAIILPFMPCNGTKGKNLPAASKKDGWYADAGKHFAEPALENVKQTLDQNAPLISEGMKGLGRDFGQSIMQSLPQNLLVAGSVALAVTAANAGIGYVERSVSGELAYEQIENKRKMLESYRSFVRSHSTMSDESKRQLIIIKESQMALTDLVQCYKSTISTWIPFTRSKLYCDENEFPMECTEEYFRYKNIFPSPYAERVQKEIFPIIYQKK